MQENRRNRREGSDTVVPSEPYIPLFSYNAVFIVNVINVQILISRMMFLPQSLLLSPMAKIWTDSV